MWELVRTDWYLKGTLPAPTIKDESNHMLTLIPCNPDKQDLFPKFVGYLRYHNGSIWSQYMVEIEDGVCKMNCLPKTDVRSFTYGLQMLIDICKQSGHVFPS